MGVQVVILNERLSKLEHLSINLEGNNSSNNIARMYDFMMGLSRGKKDSNGEKNLRVSNCDN